MSDFLMTPFASVRPSAGRVGERHLNAWLRVAFRAYLTRQSLSDLTPRELADVGLSRTAAAAEAARLPWDTKPGPRGPEVGMIGAIQGVLERARSRRLIAQMGAREVREIGIG